jgi:mannan endo-1,4-beta-mannosidase
VASLDHVVQSAEKHNVTLVINFNNNWDSYGGMPAYMSYYNLNTDQDWYQSSEAQATYQSYIKAVVSRYSSSSAIFAWELMNEPRCHGCDTSVITSWANTTSAYIKSLDSTHMVTLGDEGWAPSAGDGSYPFTTEEGIDFAANLQIPTLDYGTAHLYPSSWGVNDTEWVTEWIQAHGDACVSANKPCVMEEYGYPSDHVDVEGPWQKTMLATKGIAMDQFWQFGTTLSNGLTANDTFTIYEGTDEWTRLVTDHVKGLGSAVN